jgi:hypothetical protein
MTGVWVWAREQCLSTFFLIVGNSLYVVLVQTKFLFYLLTLAGVVSLDRWIHRHRRQNQAREPLALGPAGAPPS